MQQTLIAALAEAHQADMRRAAAATRYPSAVRPSQLRQRAGWWLVRGGLRLVDPGLAVTLAHQ